MRLPWIQLSGDAFSKASALAGLLGCSEAQALGMLVLVWRGALEWGREEEIPTGRVVGSAGAKIIAGWAQWTGPADDFVGALVTAGFLEENGSGFRVRGMSRYVAVFEERDKAKERMRTLRARSANTDARSTQFTGKTQTQTQTQIPPPSEEGCDPPGDLIAGLASAYHDATRQPYTFRPKDRVAVMRLRNEIKAPDNVIFDVWCFALKSSAFPKVRDVAGLEAHWNTLLAQASERPRTSLLAVDRPRTA